MRIDYRDEGVVNALLIGAAWNHADATGHRVAWITAHEFGIGPGWGCFTCDPDLIPYMEDAR